MRTQATSDGRPGRPFSDRQLDLLLSGLESEEGFVLLESARVTPENHRSLLFLHPVEVLTLSTGDDPDPFFKKIEQLSAKGNYLAGWFAYELGYLLEPRLRRLLPPGDYPLAVLGIYDSVQIYDHRNGRWQHRLSPAPPLLTHPENGQAPQPATPCDPLHHGPRDQRLHPNDDPGLSPSRLEMNLSERHYLEQIERIKEYIAAGDTYQVNFTLKQEIPCRGSAGALYRALRRNQGVCYAGLLNLAGSSIISLSPELFFRLQEKLCTVRPMKGTSRRGLTPQEDAKLMDFLRHDEKNRSENVMIVDLLRNDLGRICLPGSVRTTELFTVESYETLHQMTSTIKGELRPEVGVAELFRALFPCGSVTGAPKIRTMEIIRELEAEPRGVYTGAIGFIGPEREMEFNVPIRTVCLRGGKATMGIGSGIVDDSVPEREWHECKLKGEFLRRPAPPFVLIETMLWEPEAGYRLLELHRQRLLTSAAALGFFVDAAEVDSLLEESEKNFNTPRRVRLTLGKDGSLELSHTPFPADKRCFSWEELRQREEVNPTTLPTVTISPHAMDPGNRLLYHKTSLRELYDREHQKALDAGHREVLFTNTRGELSEGAVSNLFIRRDGRLQTPPLDAGLLDGVLRRHLLAAPGERGERAEERTIHPHDLLEAEAVYIGNSLRGLTRVRVDWR